MLDSVIKLNKKYYLQILLEKHKYDIKKTKTENLINDNLELSSSEDKTENDSDSETEFNNNE